jgi:hypothetical protein
MADKNFPPNFFGLKTVPGVVFVPAPCFPDMICPWCGSKDLAFMAGRFVFSARISGDDLLDGESLSLVLVVCSESHVFFLRENDFLPAASSEHAA